MLIDINGISFDEIKGKEFYLKNSDDTFMLIKDGRDYFYLLNTTTYTFVSMEYVWEYYYPFEFYRDENDEDFLGVWLIV